MSVPSFTHSIFHGRTQETVFSSHWRICVMMFLMALMSIGSAFAQQGAKISGTVTDENAAKLPSVNVILTGTRFGAATNDQGQYLIDNVPPGRYSLQARAVGYRAKSVTITVSEGQTLTQDFSLTTDVLRANEVVVTGTMAPLPKIESAVAISTITPEQLILANPRSTTEVLRYIPGFTRIESSGGEVNENYSMRGIYGVEYIMFLEDGLPVFPTMHTFFMNADNLFRQDDNIDHVEVVRGGNSALFGSNTPAAVINFIDKTGGTNLQGSTKIAFATGSYARSDFNVNGPFGQDWRFNFGGFYRYDQGVRNPGFTGIKGGQFKANITRLLDNGYIRVSGKYINDQNQFILDLPHSDPSNPTTYAQGFGDYGSFNTAEGLDLTVPTPIGRLNFPLEHGLKTDATWLTGEVGLNFGDWSFKNQLQVMNDQQEWNAIVPFNAVPLDLWVLSEAQTLQNNGFIPAGVSLSSVTAQLTYTNQFDPTGKPFAFPNAGLSPANNLVAPGGEWSVLKPLAAVQDQFQIRKAFDTGGDLFNHHDLSLGLYLAQYTQTNQWYFSDILTDVQNQTHFLDARFFYPDATAPGGVRAIDVTKNGFMHFVSNYVNGSGQCSIFSIVLSDQMKITDRLRLDLAWRWEQDNFVQSSENTATVQPDGTPVTAATAPYAVELWGNNSYRHFSKILDDWAYSAGLNFSIIPESFAFYAQASRAYKMPALDELLNASSPAQVALFEDKTTVNFEGGFKYSSPMFGFTVDGFWGELRNITGQGAILDTTTGRTTWVILSSPKQRTYGAEAEVTVLPIPELTLNANGTILKSEIGAGSDLGSWIGGVPPFIGNANVIFKVAGLNLLGDVHYVGKRWVDQPSNTFLPAYAYVNFGIGYRPTTGKGMSISLDLSNALQSRGLEEGNPRLIQYPGNRTSNFFLARPVLPRRLMLSMGYQF
jgi:iron complex outermembrane recepter protein